MPNVGPIRDPVWAILRGFKGPGTDAIYGPFMGQGPGTHAIYGPFVGS